MNEDYDVTIRELADQLKAEARAELALFLQTLADVREGLL